jgi:hypothetical protein
MVEFSNEPDLPRLHQREYSVRGYVAAPDEMLLRGVVEDTKPPGLVVEGDPSPIVMHHMEVELRIHHPSLEIVDANVVFDVHPHLGCPRITEHYRSLIGLSVARGFSSRVRELFGGPRGCTHTTALLLAMAPVAVQAWFGFDRPARVSGDPDAVRGHRERTRNTCHVWADDGELMGAVSRGESIPLAMPVVRRYEELGRTPPTHIL